MSEHFPFLKDVYFFQDLTDEEIRAISELCVERSYADGAVIFREGDGADRFFIVLEGEVEILKGDEETGELLAVRGEGHLFGEMALVDDLPRSATVRSRGKTRLLSMERGDFHRLIHQNSSVAISVLKSISLMVRRSNNSFVEGLRSRNRELEEANRDLKSAQDELLRAERLSTLGKFSSLILHDIRNPISIMRGYAEMVASRPADTERVVRAARRIVSESDRLNRLAGELLDYSRGEIRLNLQIVDLAELIGEAVEQTSGRFLSRAIEVRTDVGYRGPVLLDKERMLRVLLNLADNARKAMPHGGEFSVETQEQETTYCFTVRDTGVGMGREVLSRIFEPFFSFSEKGGTGLGMSIVKSIVEAHDGHLTVSSERMKGTEFRIVLPKYS